MSSAATRLKQELARVLPLGSFTVWRWKDRDGVRIEVRIDEEHWDKHDVVPAVYEDWQVNTTMREKLGYRL